MNKDTVMEMTDEELWIKAGRILWPGEIEFTTSEDNWRDVSLAMDGGPIIAGVPYRRTQDHLEADMARVIGPEPDDTELGVVIPDYPEDIAAAMELWEKLSEDYSTSLFKCCAQSSVTADWCASYNLDIYPPAPYDPRCVWVYAKTAARAITRAFVLAMTQDKLQGAQHEED